MRRLRALPVLVFGVLAVLAAAGAVVASGSVRHLLRAIEHPASPAHPPFVRGGGSPPALNPSAAGGGRVIVVLKQTNARVSVAHGLASRRAVDAAQQAPIVSSIKQSGGNDVRGLTLVNAVAARVSAKEAKHLATLSDVSQVLPDQQVTERVPLSAMTNNVARPPQEQCPANPNHPLTEPEALADMHFEGPGPDEADTIADGQGVVVAIDGMNELAGNPNFTRPDGEHVVEDAPDYNPADIPNDPSLDEWFGDASSVAAQGTVVYDYSKELPFSSLPAGCTFVIKGDAPGATLADLSVVDPSATVTTQNGITVATVSQSESQIIAGMQNAITLLHADVISQSYGSGGGSNLLWAADDTAVASGVTVVASSGDEGFDNTFIAPADDPDVIGVGATNTLRLLSQAYGFKSWVNDNITTLSSTGTGQPFSMPGGSGKYVDLVAPGYGGEAACSPLVTSGCPQTPPSGEPNVTGLTEAFGGTSESAPFVAGAAADVIEAYRNTHGGTSPTPAMVQQILDGTATDIDAPAGEQGAGLVNIYAAVRAAEQMPGTTLRGGGFGFGNSRGALISTPTQLDVSGDGGQTVPAQLSVYNASNSSTLVTAWLRELGPAHQLDPTVTEPVSAPPATAPVPPEGAQAAAPVRFYVPFGTDHLNANMIWPDSSNSNTLYYLLFDPQGRVVQVSYDYGTASTRPGALGTVPNIQHTEVSDPTPGVWTAQILWGNGRSHLQEPPNVPGTYTGNMSFQVTGQNYQLLPAGAGFTRIPGRSSGTVDVRVPLATAPGDHGLSVQLAGTSGATASVPVLARTFIPSSGGTFQATMGTSVGRNQGSPNALFFVNVPAGEQSMEVALNTADAAPDNSYAYELFDPNGNEVVADATPSTTDTSGPTGNANLSVANPIPGRWEIVVVLNLLTSGKEFSQAVNGDVTFNNSGVSVVSGLPTSTSTTLAQGTAQPVVLNVTNTLGVGRLYTFASNQPDIASVTVYIPAGATQQVTLQLTPTAAPSTVVSGLLAVTTKTSAAASRRNPNINIATLAVLPYTYTVGSPAP